ncbi:MAG: hypothetical protein RR806_06070 [Oscillospiraceae bacterium]
MNDIKNWAFTLCTACIVGGIVMILSPNKYERILKLLVGTVFLLCIFYPIKNIVLRFNTDNIILEDNKSLEDSCKEKTKEIFLKSASDNIKNVIIEELASIDIKADRIIVLLDLDDKFNVNVMNVEIDFPSRYEASEEKIKSRLIEKTKLSYNFNFIGEDK